MTHQNYIYQLIAWSIEWEGAIGIKKTKGYNNYYTELTISNTEIELLEEFKNTVKIGTISNGYKVKDGSDVYFWRLNRKEIEKHLPQILPYLTIKWRQAELVIQTNQI